MQKNLLRLCSIVLSIIMLCNTLPLNIWAAELQTDATATVQPSTNKQADIVEEVTEKRTEFSKVYKLSNGFHLATMYTDAVHYNEDGQWKEIDNTLTLTTSGYRNTAGLWEVSFPQQLGGNGAVSITKDGNTLSFQMSGELRSTGNVSVASVSGSNETFTITSAKTVSAQIQKVDLTEAKRVSEYPETVYEKGQSRIQYSNVYSNTNVVYDLHGNQMKESVVLSAYDAELRGYRFALNLEGLTPVLSEDGQILLYVEGTEEVSMVMPAPFLVDAGGAYNHDVVVTLTKGESGYVLSYILPSAWMASEDRQWPVVLDPVVNATLTSSNVRDATVASYGNSESYTDGTIECGYDTTSGIRRIFLMYRNLPALGSSDVIVDASVRLYKCMTSNGPRLVTVHKLHNTWESNTVTWSNYFGTNAASKHDATIDDYEYVQAAGYYTWNITDIVRGWYEGQNTGMLFKYGDETASGYMAQFYSSDYADAPTYMPAVFIVFRNNNGLESYWDYTASSAGRAGTGYINNYTGNLVWIRSDIGFGGNRMPVSINHVYNANDADNNKFGMGYGWRTNFNQLVYQWSVNGNYYVWEDADGTAHYFYYDSSIGKYRDEDGLELTLTTTGSGTSKYCLADKYGNCSYFDTNGRLTKQENNQETKSSINITYTTTSGKLISKITDGVGRVYNFTYSSSLLSQISYLGSGSTTLSYVKFGYSSSKLTSITDKDNSTCYYTYSANNHLLSATDIDGYLLTYTYTNTAADKPARVASVVEKHNSVDGGALTIEYAHNQTTFTDVSGNVQILQFNNWGNTISIQDGEGRAQYAKYATDTSSSAKGNQLSLASKLQNTVGNVLDDSSFERSTLWTATSSAVSRSIASGTAYHGSKSLKLTRSSTGTAAGVYSSSFTVGAGETYAFSAYVKTGTGMTAYLALTDGSTTKVSETLSANSDWTRLEVSYTNTGSSSKNVTARVLTTSAGTAYIDCVQVEKAPTASRYNLVDNGDFSSTTAWSSTGIPTEITPAAPQLSANVYQCTGNPSATNRISQTVKVSGSKGDTLVLAGWAKGDSAPLRGNREFSIIATFLNSSGSSVGTDKVTFNPDNNSSVAWQYAAKAMVAPAAYASVKIELAYDYNVNTVYFDGIQLYKEEFGSSYTYDANGNVTSVVDIQGGETEYTYNATTQNLSSIELPDGSITTYEYDSYHNVTKATTASGLVYKLIYDTYGNNTQVSVGSNLSVYAGYSSDGNYQTAVIDAMLNPTYYGYNADTGVVEWVRYPKNTVNTETKYTYDSMYRMATESMTTDTGTVLTATYTYANDLLTKLQTGSTTYEFNYGNFALRSSIKIGSRTLASYSYTSRTNYLSKLDYGNEDSVVYTYDKLGRVTKQTYEDGDTVSYKYDNNGALATVYDSATGRTTTYYYDFTDRLMKYVESGSGYSHSVGYTYDNINNLTALIETINGVDRTTSYSYDIDNRITSVGTAGISKNYTYDDFGRISKKETKNGSTVVLTESYTYDNNSVGFLSDQVKSVRVKSAGRDITYTYTYDKNGNILTVSDGSKTTKYTYDSANQLTREDNQAANKTWVWTYDDAGNILTKKEYAYTTGTLGTVKSTVDYGYDATWGDLLKTWNGKTIKSDTIGNMTSDGTWTYSWEHGRELASMSKDGAAWSFTYDADGIRTKRTNGSTTYTYVYNGSQLSYMGVGSDNLYFSYDASGIPVSLKYNGTIYYYATNLQGDVTAILNASGTAVVNYTYDAWGNVTTTAGANYTTLAERNPLKYRGYVYDAETELYYLQSRYYNPTIGRFINADALASTGQSILGNNMFAYCNNNPVTYSDSLGTFPVHIVIGAILGGSIEALKTLLNGGSAKDVLLHFLGGAVMGATVAIFPNSAFVFVCYDQMSLLLDCLYMGYTEEEIIMAMGINGVCQLPGTNTGDIVTDTLVDMTFGTGQDLLNFSAQQLVKGKNRDTPNPATVTNGIISVISTGGGGAGKTNMTLFDNVGRLDLWITH